MSYVNDLFTLLPELILVVLVLVVITTDLFLPMRDKWLLTPLTVFGLLLAGISCFVVWGVNATVFAGFYVVDDLSVFLTGHDHRGRHPVGAVRALVPAHPAHTAR